MTAIDLGILGGPFEDCRGSVPLHKTQSSLRRAEDFSHFPPMHNRFPVSLNAVRGWHERTQIKTKAPRACSGAFATL